MLLCSTCAGRPLPNLLNELELQREIAESLFQYWHGFLQSCTMALEDWSSPLTAMTSFRHRGATDGRPMSARLYNPTYHAAPSAAAPEVLMDEKAAAAFISFARFITRSVFSLHTQCLHRVMNCLSDPVSQTTTASEHRTKQYAGPAKPYALAAGCPWGS